ncbi:nuclear transport factor 2 family protein [Streptomyces sp. RerS4]|uniref:YybH family protein n=1 Tax=Streptomyces sp. RerS4 TaxID=2942449 RepID=UPI00201CA5AB|nr:nuclear transport factor 2 family protein [Streptomyces sp. RerS4]UQX05402.1 nuclear transport factor 2 family protein [Streptomyces sp. RerS4]
MTKHAAAARIRAMALVTALLWGVSAPASASGGADGADGGAVAAEAAGRRAAVCRAAFERDWRQYNRSFDARDADRLMGHYLPDASKIDPDGSYHQGRPAIDGLFRGLFTMDFTSEFREVRRTVVDCRTALLIVDSTLVFPEWQSTERFMSALSFTYERGHWKVIANVSTPSAPPAPAPAAG